LLLPLLLLFSFHLTPSHASFNFSGIDLCSSLTPIAGGGSFVRSLTILVENTADIHETALTFHRLFCLIRPYSGQIAIYHPLHSTRAFSCCKDGENPYDFFVRTFENLRMSPSGICTVLSRKPAEKKLIFTDYNETYCSNADDKSTFVAVSTSFWSFTESFDVSDSTHFQVNVHLSTHIRTIYELAFHLGGRNGSASNINTTLAFVKRILPTSYLRDGGPRMIVGLFYLGILLFSIVILFVALLSLVNVNEHYLKIMEEIIRERVRRHRARLQENEEEEEG
ncbi:hypothetical protein PFISCL1PPCAC_2836, partial [Pristionchus fissidentatus]